MRTRVAALLLAALPLAGANALPVRRQLPSRALQEDEGEVDLLNLMGVEGETGDSFGGNIDAGTEIDLLDGSFMGTANDDGADDDGAVSEADDLLDGGFMGTAREEAAEAIGEEIDLLDGGFMGTANDKEKAGEQAVGEQVDLLDGGFMGTANGKEDAAEEIGEDVDLLDGELMGTAKEDEPAEEKVGEEIDLLDGGFMGTANEKERAKEIGEVDLLDGGFMGTANERQRAEEHIDLDLLDGGFMGTVGQERPPPGSECVPEDMSKNCAGLYTCPAAMRKLTLIANFVNEEECKQWKTIDDRVMGGQSLSSIHHMRPGKVAGVYYSGSCRFEGNLEIEGGGFSSVRWKPEYAWLTEKVRGAAGLVLKARGDGRIGYKFSVWTTDSYSETQAKYVYQQGFEPNKHYSHLVDAPGGVQVSRGFDGNWPEDEILLPFADFQPRKEGKPHDGPQLEGKDVRQFGVMLSRFPPFARGVDEASAIQQVNSGPFWLQLQALYAFECLDPGTNDVEEAEFVDEPDAAGAAEEADPYDTWMDQWQGAVDSWWNATGPFPGSYTDAAECAAGMGLSLASMLEQKLKMARCLLGHLPSCRARTSTNTERPKSGCEWVRTMKEELNLPDFPDIPSPFKFSLPAVPALPGRLLPQGLQLQLHGATPPEWTQWAIAQGGASATIALAGSARGGALGVPSNSAGAPSGAAALGGALGGALGAGRSGGAEAAGSSGGLQGGSRGHGKSNRGEIIASSLAGGLAGAGIAAMAMGAMAMHRWRRRHEDGGFPVDHNQGGLVASASTTAQMSA